MVTYGERRNSYIERLKDILFVERIALGEYAAKMGVSSYEILNPGSETKLALAEKALEMYPIIQSVPKLIEFDPNNNTAYAFEWLKVNSFWKKEYIELVADIFAFMHSGEYLRGRFLTDAMVMPIKIVTELADDTETIDGYSSIILRAKEIVKERGYIIPPTTGLQPGVAGWVSKNECVCVYMNERGAHPEQDESVRMLLVKNRVK